MVLPAVGRWPISPPATRSGRQSVLVSVVCLFVGSAIVRRDRRSLGRISLEGIGLAWFASRAPLSYAARWDRGVSPARPAGRWAGPRCSAPQSPSPLRPLGEPHTRGTVVGPHGRVLPSTRPLKRVSIPLSWIDQTTVAVLSPAVWGVIITQGLSIKFSPSSRLTAEPGDVGTGRLPIAVTAGSLIHRRCVSTRLLKRFAGFRRPSVHRRGLRTAAGLNPFVRRARRSLPAPTGRQSFASNRRVLRVSPSHFSALSLA